MKTKEELNALTEETETVTKKLEDLTDDELAQVAGGSGFIKYLVKEGDTLWDLAIKCQSSVQTIFLMNTKVIKDPNKIYPGMVLTLPWPY